MSQTTPLEGKNSIMSAFNKLLVQYQQIESKVATKEEEAEKAKNQQLLAKAVDYTVDNIVNTMASLQLDFGGAIDQITGKLTSESAKLEEIKKAIAIERNHLQQLSQIRLVADALHILEQEHQEKLRLLEERTNNQIEVIEKEIAQRHKEWEKEAREFTIKVTEEDERLTDLRQQEEADYQYEIARQRKIATDDYEEDKRQQERQLLEIGQTKEKDWKQREQYLAENQEKFATNQEKITGFEEKIKEEYNKAKEEAIKEANSKAKVETDLLEKEWEASKQGYEFQLQSLQETIERQNQQIASLTLQLQESNTQAQNLAMRAFNN